MKLAYFINGIKINQLIHTPHLMPTFIVPTPPQINLLDSPNLNPEPIFDDKIVEYKLHHVENFWFLKKPIKVGIYYTPQESYISWNNNERWKLLINIVEKFL